MVQTLERFCCLLYELIYLHSSRQCKCIWKSHPRQISNQLTMPWKSYEYQILTQTVLNKYRLAFYLHIIVTPSWFLLYRHQDVHIHSRLSKENTVSYLWLQKIVGYSPANCTLNDKNKHKGLAYWRRNTNIFKAECNSVLKSCRGTRQQSHILEYEWE